LFQNPVGTVVKDKGLDIFENTKSTRGLLLDYSKSELKKGIGFFIRSEGFNTQEPAHRFAVELQGEVVD
jgi:hypothetical protein